MHNLQRDTQVLPFNLFTISTHKLKFDYWRSYLFVVLCWKQCVYISMKQLCQFLENNMEVVQMLDIICYYCSNPRLQFYKDSQLEKCSKYNID